MQRLIEATYLIICSILIVPAFVYLFAVGYLMESVLFVTNKISKLINKNKKL